MCRMKLQFLHFTLSQHPLAVHIIIYFLYTVHHATISIFLKLSPSKICYCATDFGQFGQRQVHRRSGGVFCLPHYCSPCFIIYSVPKGSQYSLSNATCFISFGILVVYYVCNVMLWMILFKNIVDKKTLITVVVKAQQFPRISVCMQPGK